MHLSITNFYELYTGGHFVTSNSFYTWPLINEPETTNARDKRINRSAYPNFQFKIVEIYKNYTLSGKPIFDDSAVLKPMHLAVSMLHHMLIGGHCYALTLGSGITKIYRADCVEENDGVFTITGKDEDHKIVVTDTTITIYKGEEQPIEEPRTYHEQLLKCYWNDEMSSLIRDTANMNIQIYNYTSVLDTLVLQSANYNTTGPALADKTRIEPYQHIPQNNGEQPFQFVQPDTGIMKQIREEIENRVMNMAAIVGLVREFSEQLKIDASGKAHSFQMFDTNATILQIAKSTEKWVNIIAEVSQKLAGGKTASITLDPILSPTADEEKLNQLRWIRDNINDPQAIIEANVAIADIGFSHLSEARKTEVLTSIRATGINGKTRPELTFDEPI